MAVWSTPNGRVIWEIEGGRGYAEIDPLKLAVHVVHSDGTTASEDDLYEWSFFVQGSELVKRFATTPYEEPTEISFSVAVGGLVALAGEDADRWEAAARQMYLAYGGARNEEANEQKRQERQRAGTFLAALPESCLGLVFRSIRGGWGVFLDGADEPIWSETNYAWRGKDLHYELQRVLKTERPDIESFGTDLKDMGEQMSYYGE